MNKIEATMQKMIEALPNHKLIYILKQPSYVRGMWNTLQNHCGISFNEENHDALVRVVEQKLTGCDDVEYEWKEEHAGFIFFKM
jgi:hypothetical protein